MSDLKIEGTPKTPTIEFNSKSGYILIKGRSIPENSVQFYKPLIAALEDYNKDPQPNTNVDIQLDYFNTSSSKCILDILRKLEKLHKTGKSVVVNWYYEEDDEDMMEAGENYQRIVSVPIELALLEEE